MLLIQKCPQFSPKLSASNACMLVTFSLSGYESDRIIKQEVTFTHFQVVTVKIGRKAYQCNGTSLLFKQPSFAGSFKGLTHPSDHDPS